jgi:hypothetical protein
MSDDSIHVDPEGAEEAEEMKLNGFQFVRTEFLAHLHEPSFSFNDGKVGVNAACVKRLPTVDYIQILINRETRMLVVKPCDEFDLFSFRWCTVKGDKRIPRQVTGRLFFMKVCDMMDWNPDHRHKVLGKLCKANGEFIFAFDLKAVSTYERTITAEGKRKTSRTPVLPAEWKDQFGIPYEEHKKALQINMFDGFALFSLGEKPQNGTDDQQSDSDGSNGGQQTDGRTP